MGLWAEVKRSCYTSVPTGSREPILEVSHDPSLGKKLIDKTMDQIIAIWDEIPQKEAPMAYDWIVLGSPHGAKAQAAQDEVDRISRYGDLSALRAACNGWLNSCREGIEGWKRRLPASQTVIPFIDEEVARCAKQTN